MKLRHGLMIAGLSLAMGVAGLASLAASGPKNEVVADSVTYTGSIALEFQTNGYGQGWYWDDSNAKIALYFHSASGNGWSTMIQTDAGGNHKYEISYSLGFDPQASSAQIDLYRYSNEHSNEPEAANYWNRYQNISYGNVIYFKSTGNAEAAETYPGINYATQIVSTGSANGTKLSFTKFGSNVEAYRQRVSLDENETFTISSNGGPYYALKAGVSDTYFAVVGSSIKCKVEGTYDLYFDTSSHELWAQVDAVTEARGFATTFLNATKTICASGSSGTSSDHSEALASIWNVKEPADGTSLVEKWGELTTGAKSNFRESKDATILDARDRYIHIMKRYGSPTLTEFANGPSYSGSHVVITNSPRAAQSDTLLVAGLAGASVTLAAGWLIISRRRKQIK